MFVIHYTDAKGSLVAIEGPVACKHSAETYLESREHYLEFTPRILSMSAPRTGAALPGAQHLLALPAPSAEEITYCPCGLRAAAQPEFA